MDALAIGALLVGGALMATWVGAALAESIQPGRPAVIFALSWGLLVFAPLCWYLLDAQPRWSAIPAYDFAGAVPLHVGGGVTFLTIAVVAQFRSRARLRPNRSRQWSTIRWILPLVVVLWIGRSLLWEPDLDFIVIIAGNALTTTVLSWVAALGLEKIKSKKVSSAGHLLGVLTGLAAATSSCVFVEPIAAGAIGIVVGALAGAIAFARGDSRINSLAGLGAVSQLTGGMGGLLLLGLLAQTRGFFYTGGFTLLAVQPAVVVVGAVYALLLSVPLVLLARRSDTPRGVESAV